MHSFRRFALPLLCALAGCGDGSTRYALSDGTEVTVASSGAFTVRAAGRTVFATAPRAAITARSFVRLPEMLIGFYDFPRTEEQAFPFTGFDGSTQVGDAVELAFTDTTGASATVTIAPGTTPRTTHIHVEAIGITKLSSLAVPLRCDDDASFLGFGAQYNGTDQRGQAFELWVEEQGIGRRGDWWFFDGDAHTSYLPMPYFLDARGFGLIADTSARVVVDLCKTDPHVAWMEVDRDDAPMDLVVLHGPTPADVVQTVGDLYGRPRALRPWALGPWIGIQGGQEAVLDEADALEAAGVPVTALWAQDWVGRRNFTDDQIGVKYHWNVDTMLYPDLAGMITMLHDRDIRFLGYANPFVDRPLEHFDEMAEQGLLIANESGAPYTLTTASASSGSLPDLTNPAARAYVRGFLEAMVNDFGMDGWMCDFGEWLPIDARLFDGSDAYLQHNLYPGQWHGMHREVLEAARDDDFALFSRSGWLGTQGSAQIVWIGDQEADFETTDGLPTVIPALLNLGLSGVPFVTHDIAGFSGGPSTKELYLRWTELGAFTTVMRTHEGIKRDLNWNWDADAETTAHFRRFARIHEALVPTLLSLVEEAAASSMPPMRHLVLVFPDDTNVVGLADQFMLGNDLLVAPVVHEGMTEREVYLPAGTWYDVWTGQAVSGGRTLTWPAPIGAPPVFSRSVDRADLRAL